MSLGVPLCCFGLLVVDMLKRTQKEAAPLQIEGWTQRAEALRHNTPPQTDICARHTKRGLRILCGVCSVIVLVCGISTVRCFGCGISTMRCFVCVESALVRELGMLADEQCDLVLLTIDISLRKLAFVRERGRGLGLRSTVAVALFDDVVMERRDTRDVVVVRLADVDAVGFDEIEELHVTSARAVRQRWNRRRFSVELLELELA